MQRGVCWQAWTRAEPEKLSGADRPWFRAPASDPLLTRETIPATRSRRASRRPACLKIETAPRRRRSAGRGWFLVASPGLLALRSPHVTITAVMLPSGSGARSGSEDRAHGSVHRRQDEMPQPRSRRGERLSGPYRGQAERVRERRGACPFKRSPIRAPLAGDGRGRRG